MGRTGVRARSLDRALCCCTAQPRQESSENQESICPQTQGQLSCAQLAARTGQAFWEKGEVRGAGSGLGQRCALPFLPLPLPLAGYSFSVFNCSLASVFPSAKPLGEMEGALDNRASTWPTRTHSGSLCPLFAGNSHLVTMLSKGRGLLMGRNTQEKDPGQRRLKVATGIQAGGLNCVHSVQFGGLPGSPPPPVSEVIFPICSYACVPLMNTVCLGSHPDLWFQVHNFWESGGGLRQILAQ